MKALTVDFECVIQSMRDLCRQADDYYLDKSTGKVFAVPRSLVRSLEQERRDERPDFPEWDVQLIPLAREIVLGASPQFVRVPEAFGKPEHRWMLEFARGIRSFRLKQRLYVALRGRGSAQRFKEILKETPEEARKWTAFCQAHWEEKIQIWLESLGILAVYARPRARASS